VKAALRDRRCSEFQVQAQRGHDHGSAISVVMYCRPAAGKNPRQRWSV
jgi:hypothetical protein